MQANNVPIILSILLHCKTVRNLGLNDESGADKYLLTFHNRPLRKLGSVSIDARRFRCAGANIQIYRPSEHEIAAADCLRNRVSKKLYYYVSSQSIVTHDFKISAYKLELLQNM